MHPKLKTILKNTRIIILAVFLVFAVVAISPSPWNEGVAIRNVIANSSASDARIPQPKLSTPLTARERIISIDNKAVKTPDDYYSLISNLKINQSIQIKTKGHYTGLLLERNLILLKLMKH
jgi:S1-C subfamily serine protease